MQGGGAASLKLKQPPGIRHTRKSPRDKAVRESGAGETGTEQIFKEGWRCSEIQGTRQGERHPESRLGGEDTTGLGLSTSAGHRAQRAGGGPPPGGQGQMAFCSWATGPFLGWGHAACPKQLTRLRPGNPPAHELEILLA